MGDGDVVDHGAERNANIGDVTRGDRRSQMDLDGALLPFDAEGSGECSDN